nr:extracellular protein 47 [Fulvia fulva]
MLSLFLFPVALLSPIALASPLEKRAITCLKVGSIATASWTNAAGQRCTFSGIVGSNYGTNSAGGEYSCNGRCGAGCSGASIGNAYTQDCFSHDICSYFENASGGARDANCGAAYNSAIDDTAFGTVNGCGQTNPSNNAQAPSGSPTCS